MAARSTAVRSVARKTLAEKVRVHDPKAARRPKPKSAVRKTAKESRDPKLPILYVHGYRQRLGSRLRELRQKNRLTAYDIQNELARHGVIIPFWRLYALEDGKATFQIDYAPGLARVFGLADVRELFPIE